MEILISPQLSQRFQSFTMDSFSYSSSLLIFVLVFNLRNLILADEASTTQEPSLTVPQISNNKSVVTTTFRPNEKTNMSTTKGPIIKKKEVEIIAPDPPSTQLRLDGENLKLNITALENTVEFTVMINNKIQNSSKRLLLALENDHFNVDVISIPFLSNGLSVGKKIEAS